MSQDFDIAIVGAGCSGTLVATQLLRKASGPLRIALLEREPSQLAAGVAYGTAGVGHLLNVPASNMSAFPDEPGDFVAWASEQCTHYRDTLLAYDLERSAFLPRRVYGDYLQASLARAEAAAGRGVRLERMIAEVRGVALNDGTVRLNRGDGGELRASRVVLALGNFRPGDPSIATPRLLQSFRYHGDPWELSLLPALLRTRSCLLIGSGLTMVDWTITLQQAGYQGVIHSISRRGLWPHAHRKATPVEFDFDLEAKPLTARSWLRQMRAVIRASGCDWRPVVDALRPRSAMLWAALPRVEQRRFLRHLRPFWDVHRHRLAPEVADQLGRLRDSGRLVRHVGRLVGLAETETGVDARIRRRGADVTETVSVEAILNCSGSESDYRKLDQPLVRSLLEQDLVRPDPLALGLKVDPNGAVIDSAGHISPYLFTLGPPAKGVRWETTAVPEIRAQAAQLAEHLLAHLA